MSEPKFIGWGSMRVQGGEINYNSGNHNSGFFCTNTPKAFFFDAPTDLDWSDAAKLIPPIDLSIGCVWVPQSSMSDEEKEKFPDYKILGGFLKIRDLSLTESFPVAWAKMSQGEKAKWTSLPNFDALKFLEITGVDVRCRTITIDGRDIEISEESYQSLRRKLIELIER